MSLMFGWYVASSASPSDPWQLRELAQVLARREAAARARDHDGAHGRVGSLLERRPECRVQRPVERVEDVRAG